MASREQLQDTLCKRLFWHTAERNDGKVADYLFHRHEMDVVYAMDEATLFDGFLDGKVLYAIDLQGIEFAIPLKRNMEAAKDARQLALNHASLPPVTREISVPRGYGKKTLY